MLKILQARLQQYVNWELPDGQAGFRNGRGTSGQIASICWIMDKTREFQKNTKFCIIDYTKVFDCVAHNKLWKIQEWEIPDYLSWENYMQQLEPDMQQLIGSKLGRIWEGCIVILLI